MCVCGGGGAQLLQCKSSQPNVQKNSRALVKTMGGLKFGKKSAGKTKKSTP